MTSFLTAAATMQTLSLAAMEEASRRGQRDADLEHLFLALVISDQAAGQALRSAGITLDRARDAVEALHAAQLESIGIAPGEPLAGPIVFHETSGYEWTPRAMKVLQCAGRKRGGDASDVLRELLIEPSGLIDDLLQRLGTSRAEVSAALADQDRPEAPSKADPRWSRGAVVSRAEAFVPADIEEVWALLADPARMPDWNPAVGSVAARANGDGLESTFGPAWWAFVRTHRPDGKELGVKEQYRRRLVTLVTVEQPRRIAWRTTFPDAKRANAHLLEIELAPTVGGTQLQLVDSWTRRGGWRTVALWPLRPIQRFLTWVTLFQTAAGISRAFR